MQCLNIIFPSLKKQRNIYIFFIFCFVKEASLLLIIIPVLKFNYYLYAKRKRRFNLSTTLLSSRRLTFFFPSLACASLMPLNSNFYCIHLNSSWACDRCCSQPPFVLHGCSIPDGEWLDFHNSILRSRRVKMNIIT